MPFDITLAKRRQFHFTIPNEIAYARVFIITPELNVTLYIVKTNNEEVSPCGSFPSAITDLGFVLFIVNFNQYKWIHFAEGFCVSQELSLKNLDFKHMVRLNLLLLKLGDRGRVLQGSPFDVFLKCLEEGTFQSTH